MATLKVARVADGHYQVDMRGWVCPYPKYAVEPLVAKLPQGHRMDMLVDCPAATSDVPKVARSLGCEVPEVVPIADGEWQIVIVRAPHQVAVSSGTPAV